MQLKRVSTFVIALFLILTLVAISFGTACVNSSTTSKSSTPDQVQSVSTSTTSSQTNVIKINYAYYSNAIVTPELGLGVDEQEWWCNQLNELSGGRVEAKFYPSETLCKSADSLKALDAGIAHVTRFGLSSMPGRFPITDFITGSPILKGNMRLNMEVLDKLLWDGMLKEYQGYVLLAWHPSSPIRLFTNKKIVKMEDLKNLKIRVVGETANKMVSVLGASPTAIDSPNLYMSLERGLIDGLGTSLSFYQKMKLNEVTTYCIDHTIYGGVMPILMKEEFWNSLPGDIKAIILQLNKRLQYYSLLVEEYGDYNGYQVASTGKNQVYKLDPDEWLRWQSLFDSIIEEQAAKIDSQGLLGTKSWDIAKQALGVSQK